MSTPRYKIPSILIHWLMAVLIAAAYATIELREAFPRGSAPRVALKEWHYALGLTIFALVWVRLLLRLALPVGSHDPTPPRWQRLASGGVHLALYVVMIAMPLLGWALLSAEGEAAGWFGFALPPLVGPNESLAEMLEELHETVGKAGYVLIGVHAAAALVHHYLFRDQLLVRMLKVRSRPA